MSTFLDKLKAKWEENKFICIGLDNGEFEFDKSIIDQTHDLVCAYKPNAAFYKEAELQKTVDYIKSNHPDIPIILDAKRGDIGNTNEAYVKAIFDDLGADAVTVHPYLGKESLGPFLKRADKGIFVLVKTSNPGAGEFQDLEVGDRLLYQVVAEHVKNWGSNLGVVVGATYPEELKKVREIVGDMPILVPGIGAQGGNLKAVIKNGLNSQKQGLIISSSRGIIFAENPREATQNLHLQIQEVLKNV
ncbi:MAG: orotidine-5'-phosphate decarboxylase [Candidatus Daviesbacteria bacterium]|nr:orotidine-5'-phosphate decarboxylase [Candidatus Daviesbacteria bacterium]